MTNPDTHGMGELVRAMFGGTPPASEGPPYVHAHMEFDTDPTRVAARMDAPDEEDVLIAFIRARLAEVRGQWIGEEPLERVVDWAERQIAGWAGAPPDIGVEAGVRLLEGIAALWFRHPDYPALLAELERIRAL
jgi:hypothetical protein